jgi:fructosamine-3-kinase
VNDYPPLLDELGLGAPSSIRPVGGGCIADARIAEFQDGSRVFVKTAAGQHAMFPCEANGLEALAGAAAIRVPKVLAVSEAALALECISPGNRGADFFAEFGRQFAALHRFEGKAFGFHEDNYIGSTPQRNRPLDGAWEEAPDDDGSGWPAFFLERRLRYQAELAERNGFGSELPGLLDRAEVPLMESLGAALETPRLLHGDLWGGNYMVDEGGSPVLIDPAAYFGHREADLAMTRLFGGFDPRFYDAYQEAFPLQPGHEERLPAYQLYHLFNHLNLFGRSYYAQCRSILQYYSR